MADPIQRRPRSPDPVCRPRQGDPGRSRREGWRMGVASRYRGGHGLVKTTAFNLVMALVEVRLVEHNAALGAYRLGFELMGYGRTVERRSDILGLMRPYLVRLCAKTRETVNLALPCPTDVLIVDSLEGSQSLRITSYAGTRSSYHSTACGRALLAFGSDCDPPPDPVRPAVRGARRRTRRPSPTRSKRSSRECRRARLRGGGRGERGRRGLRRRAAPRRQGRGHRRGERRGAADPDGAGNPGACRRAAGRDARGGSPQPSPTLARWSESS